MQQTLDRLINLELVSFTWTDQKSFGRYQRCFYLLSKVLSNFLWAVSCRTHFLTDKLNQDRAQKEAHLLRMRSLCQRHCVPWVSSLSHLFSRLKSIEVQSISIVSRLKTAHIFHTPHILPDILTLKRTSLRKKRRKLNLFKSILCLSNTLSRSHNQPYCKQPTLWSVVSM